MVFLLPKRAKRYLLNKTQSNFYEKTYTTPQTTAIALDIESNILNDVSMPVSSEEDDTITSDCFLSNKKENNVWGESKRGPWGNMK